MNFENCISGEVLKSAKSPNLLTFKTSDFWKLLRPPFSELNNFLWVCWFLGKNLSNFVPSVWKLHNPYCHNLHESLNGVIWWKHSSTKRIFISRAKSSCEKIINNMVTASQLLKQSQSSIFMTLFSISFIYRFIKFIYSEKATKFCEIFTLLLTGTT